MITGGIDELYKILLIVFYGLNYDPSLVVKISRTEESASQLNMESNVLKTINEKYKNIEGIPRILFSNHTTDAHVNVQTVINGALLASVLNKDSFPELARLTTLWLVELAKSTKTRPPEDWREKMVHSVLSDINSSAAKIIDSHFMDQTIHILGDFNIPCLVCEHRDFGPQNILVDSESKLGVIDWEFSRLHGIPALDLIFFLTRAGFILRGAPKSITYGDCYREMLDPDTFTGGVFRDCLDYYTSALDIPGSEIPSLRLMTWIVHYFWRMFGDKRYTPEPGHRESSINHWTLTLWKEELSISGLSE
ncbi:MAG: aminoglycoside phosphotransferase family protein [Deltaproteobacteria bacterium]